MSGDERNGGDRGRNDRGRGDRGRDHRAGDDRAGDDRNGDRTAGRRDPERERRAAERARRIRERRAAERAAADDAGGGATDRTRADGARNDRARADSARADGTRNDGADGGGAGRAAATVRERTAARAAGRSRAGDPRYRRRRAVAVLATVAVALIGLSAAGWWALARYGPAVAAVEVTGTRQIPVHDVEDAAGVEDGVPLAAVDTAAIAARVSAIPGVAAVDVGRSWPDTISVAVTERTPAAVVDTPDGPRLVDVSGFVYRDAPPDVRLPRLALPRVAPDDPATLAAVTVLQALPAPVRDQVQSLGLGDGGTTFELALTEDRRVLWGPWADSAGTAERARVLEPLLTREGAVYDVSSPSLVTVRHR